MTQEERNSLDPIPQVTDLHDAQPLDLAKAIGSILDAKKARDIRILKLEQPSDLTDIMVLASGTSRTHVQSLSGDVEYWTGVKNEKPLRSEGRNGGNWIVLDYGNVMVHVMSRETRDFYNLENLYADAKRISFESESEA